MNNIPGNRRRGRNCIFSVLAGWMMMGWMIVGGNILAQSAGDHADSGSDPDFASLFETVFPNLEVEVPEDVYESFLQIYQHPVDLNLADHSDLQNLFFLSDAEISRILQHRELYGGFLSLQELYLIDGIDSATVTLVREFLTIGDFSPDTMDSISFLQKLSDYSRYDLMFRYGRTLENRRGFINRADPEELLKKRYYVGSPDQLYLRFTLEVPGELKAGMTAEKDAGEMIFISPKSKGYGFDHYSGFVEKKYHSWLKRILLGNYKVQAGQGLVLGSGLFVGKGTEPIRTAVRQGQGVSPYQGATEYGFFRGMALELGGEKWKTIPFISHQGLDVSLYQVEDSSNETDTSEIFGKNKDSPLIRSILATGYHRTPAELLKKDAAQMTSAGILMQYQSIIRNFSTGISVVWDRLNLPVKRIRNYYNIFDFSGREQLNAGINYHFTHGKFHLFGEGALSKSSGWSFIQGIIAHLGSVMETLLHLRHYDPHYHTFHGRSFGEYAAIKNEQGVYWGIKLHALAKLDADFYFDIFRSNWLRYGVASPSAGYEWLTGVKLNAGRNTMVELYFKQERKIHNQPENRGNEYSLLPGTKRRAWLTYRYLPETGFQARSRIQATHYAFFNDNNFGIALIQDAGYQFSKGYIKGRISYFRAEDYQTRQYDYEPDLLYYFSVPSYYGHGWRFLLLFKFSPVNKLDFWIKLGQYQFLDRDAIGTGLDEIDGHKKTEIRCQIRFKF